MTHREAVVKSLRKFGKLSDYSLFHTVRAQGIKASPSSVRTRRRELTDMGVIKPVADQFEVTPSGRRAQLWKLA